MRRRRNYTRRLMRGDVARPGKYWTSFVIASFIVHAVMLTAVSGVAESFISSLSKPRPQTPPVLYVGLVFTEPSPIGRASVPKVDQVQPETNDAKPGKQGRPAKQAAKKKPAQYPPAKTADTKKRQPESEHARPRPDLARLIGPVPESRPKAVKPAEPKISAPDNNGAKEKAPPFTKKTKPPLVPRTVEDKAEAKNAAPELGLTSAEADRKYVEFFRPEDGSITLIRGTQTSTLSTAEFSGSTSVPEVEKPILKPVPMKGTVSIPSQQDQRPAQLQNLSITAKPPAAISKKYVKPLPEKKLLSRLEHAPHGPGPLSNMSIGPAPLGQAIKPAPRVRPEKYALNLMAPELPEPAPLSNLSIRQPAVRDNKPTASALPEPLLSFSLPAAKLVREAETPETVSPYRPLIGVRGLNIASVDRRDIDAPSSLFAMFWEMMKKPAPAETRPEPLYYGSLDASDFKPAPAPEPRAGDGPSRIAPVVHTVSPPMLPEPVPMRPPKIIVVGEYASETDEPPFLAFTEPSPGDTDKSLIEVRGEVSGDGITSVLFTMGRTRRELLVTGGAFTTSVALEEGRNVLTAAALDSFGRAARTRVILNYVPAAEETIISFITPRDGGIIDALETAELYISGTVSGKGAESVRLYLNRSISDVTVENGEFHFYAPIEVEDNTLYAEADSPDGTTSRSPDIRFRVLNLYPMDITVLMKLEGPDDGVTMEHRWRPHPLSDEPEAKRPPEFRSSGTRDGRLTEVEYAEGIFTVGAAYELEPGVTVQAVFDVTLYGHDPSRKKTKSFGPFVLRGRGHIPAVRVLMPESVFWEDDHWFSGMIESGSGTTKFRQPEGIIWREED